MPRPRPPYLCRQRTRHGAFVWYVRKGRGLRIRIREEFGTPAFMEAYHAALAGEGNAARKPKESAGSLAWVIARYRDSSAWAALSMATKRQRENIFLRVIKAAGDVPTSAITRAKIREAIEDRKATPFAANNFLKTMRGLFRWALDSDLISEDPTLNVKPPKMKTRGFHAWTEDEIKQFENRWPVGSRERLALAVLLYTGLRRGDAAALGRQHIRNSVIVIRTEKTNTVVAIPVLPELQAIIEASPTGDLALIARHDGRPMVKEGFGNWFKKACEAAGVPGSAHGLRKAGAARLANNGATVAQLEAIFGWEGGKMASLYTRTADRARLARDAIGGLARDEKANVYPLTGETNRPSPKTESKT